MFIKYVSSFQCSAGLGIFFKLGFQNIEVQRNSVIKTFKGPGFITEENLQRREICSHKRRDWNFGIYNGVESSMGAFITRFPCNKINESSESWNSPQFKI